MDTPLSEIEIAENLCHRGFHLVDHFLLPHQYDALSHTIHTLADENHFKLAKIGQRGSKTENVSIRNDKILWIDKLTTDQSILPFLAKLDGLCQILNQTLFLGLVDYETHFAIYPPQHFYKKHVDQFANKRDRRVSCVYYLNHDWQKAYGGELKLYDKEDTSLAIINPIGNRFVLFNSDLPHEVCTTYQTRYSIAAWLKARPMMLVE